jgi:hypothetical protein
VADAETPPGEPELCSAKGCREPATWQLRWNNPRIHTPDRRKTWLACERHRQSLAYFLGARGFLRETVAHPPVA